MSDIDKITPLDAILSLNGDRVSCMGHLNAVFYLGLARSVTSELSTENTQLYEALDDLMTYQNGPPLETEKEGWQEVYNRCEKLLEKHKKG